MSRSQPSSPSRRSKSEITRKRSASSGPPHKRARTDAPLEPPRSLTFQCFNSSISILSDEVLLQIFSNLSEDGLLTMGAVSGRFRRISNDISLWKKLYHRVFEYQMPLYHPRPCEFEFREPSHWRNVVNPWKESFRQLRHGVHVRPDCAHIYARHGEHSIRHFENLDAAIEHCNSLKEDEELLIFLHDTVLFRSRQITINRPLQIIGAGSSPNFQESVIIENGSGVSITYAEGSGNAYLGYCTIKFLARDPSLAFCAIRISARSTPVIEHCKFSMICPGDEDGETSMIRVEDDGTNPQIRNCFICSESIGIYITDRATGMYKNCEVANSRSPGIWVKNRANPFFQSCHIHDGVKVGILLSEFGMGYFEKCDIHNNRASGIEVKNYGNPTIVQCDVHHGEAGGIYLHDHGYGQFIENRIFANQLAGMWITSQSNPTVRKNDIFSGEQGGVHIYGDGRGLIEQNNIFHNKLAGLQIHTRSDPIVRLNKIHSGYYGGIYVNENGKGLIEENEIYGNERAGVWVSTESCPVLRKNRIHSGKQVGVYFFNNGNGLLEENDIFNNVHSGIEIRTGSNPQIIRNKIWGSQDTGVFVYSSGRGVLEENKIFLNMIAGVWIKTDSEPVLRRNKIYDGRETGIFIFSKGRGILEENDIYRNTNTGVLISSGSHPVLRRNQIYKGHGVGVEITSGATATLESNSIFENEAGGLFLASGVNPEMRDNSIHDNHNAVDEAIDAGLCLIKISSRTSFPMHDYYRCKTCTSKDRITICANCIHSCHEGHDVWFVRRDRFLCDCGVGSLNRLCTLRLMTRPGFTLHDSAAPKAPETT